MEEVELIEIGINIIEGMAVLISIMMGALCYFYVVDRRNTAKRIDKQDENINALVKFMRDQQKQITDITNKMNKTVELIGVNQENDREQMGFLKELVLEAIKK